VLHIPAYKSSRLRSWVDRKVREPQKSREGTNRHERHWKERKEEKRIGKRWGKTGRTGKATAP